MRVTHAKKAKLLYYLKVVFKFVYFVCKVRTTPLLMSKLKSKLISSPSTCLSVQHVKRLELPQKFNGKQETGQIRKTNR